MLEGRNLLDVRHTSLMINGRICEQSWSKDTMESQSEEFVTETVWKMRCWLAESQARQLRAHDLKVALSSAQFLSIPSISSSGRNCAITYRSPFGRASRVDLGNREGPERKR
jgi:hypothetical protein